MKIVYILEFNTSHRIHMPRYVKNNKDEETRAWKICGIMKVLVRTSEMQVALLAEICTWKE